MIYAFSMILATVLNACFFDKTFEPNRLIFFILYFAVVGPVVGSVSWWEMERKYRAARIDARTKAGKEIPPSSASKAQ
jgi:hypothetical protein